MTRLPAYLFIALSFVGFSANAQSPESELKNRIRYWESRAFSCSSDYGAFPSKEGDGGAPACDDGDSVMFNALLCRAGDERGCKTVIQSQDEDGRFWRSPKKRQTRPEEPSGLKDGETTFSGDHAVGLMVYFGHSGDKSAFERWVKWIDSNERCLTFCGAMPVGTPRYCKNDRCAFRLGDCQTLLLLGQRLNVGVPFCAVDPVTPVPTVTNVAQALKNTYDETLGKFPVQPPGLKLLRDNFDGALRAYEDAVRPIEQLRTQVFASAVRTLLMTQIEKALSARFNDRGFSRHNAMVQIMMLQDWGLGNRWMSNEATRVAKDEPLNPFFQYAAYRRQNKASMLPLILDECPSKSTDREHLRRQWSWERDSAKREWAETMYWDCMFIAAMYFEQGVPPPDDNTTEDAVRQALKIAIDGISKPQKAAEDALQEIAALLKTLSDPTKALGDKIKKKAKELEQTVTNPGAAVEKKKEQVQKIIKNPAEAAKDPVGTLKKLSPYKH